MALPEIKRVDRNSDNVSTQRDLDRPTAYQIYEQVSRNGRRELGRSNLPLAISGIAGGLLMGLTGLAVAILTATIGGTQVGRTIALFFYPLGFVVVIIGRAQLFTENTLYPVALMLTERGHALSTLRLWSIVFPANILGAFAFALLAVETGALQPEFVSALAQLGVQAASVTASHAFWSGVMGGWIIATVAWLVSGSHSITGSVMLIWIMTFVVGLGHFAHCVASSGEILASVLAGRESVGNFLRWLAPATGGNICGGVLLVTLLEYGQSKLE